MNRPLPIVLLSFYLFVSGPLSIIFGSLQSFLLQVDFFSGLLGVVLFLAGFMMIAAGYGLWSRQPWGLQILVYTAIFHIFYGAFALIQSNNMISSMLFSRYIKIWAIITIIAGLYMIYVSQQSNVASLYAEKPKDIGIRIGVPSGPATQALPNYIVSALLPGGQIARSEISSAQKSCTIGRSRDQANLVINDDTVSRAHARLDLRNGELWLTDLGSTNGTQLGDAPVKGSEARVRSGDRITVGSVIITVSRG